MAIANGGGSRALDVTSRRQQWRNMERANKNGNVSSAPRQRITALECPLAGDLLWTATEVDSERAYIVVYDGKVWQRRKAFAPATLGYRCVKPV